MLLSKDTWEVYFRFVPLRSRKELFCSRILEFEIKVLFSLRLKTLSERLSGPITV